MTDTNFDLAMIRTIQSLAGYLMNCRNLQFLKSIDFKKKIIIIGTINNPFFDK